MFVYLLSYHAIFITGMISERYTLCDITTFTSFVSYLLSYYVVSISDKILHVAVTYTGQTIINT